MPKDGDLYRPSNGSEGMWFEGEFCDQCLNQNPDPDPKYTKPKNCEICMAAMCFSSHEKGYPKEWQYRDGKPTCTAFIKWDWGNDGDPDDPDNPNRPPDPPDPSQLDLFPLSPNEKDYEIGKEEKFIQGIPGTQPGLFEVVR